MFVNKSIIRCLLVLHERVLLFESKGAHSTNSEVYKTWRSAENMLLRFNTDWAGYDLYLRYISNYWDRRIDHHFGALHELGKI